MGIKITDATADTAITGVEMIPVSDNGSPKRVTTDQIKNFTIDQIEAIAAGTSVSSSDGIFILQSGALKPVSIDTVLQRAINTIWGKSTESDPDSADVLILKDGITEKTVTLAKMAKYVQATIKAAVLDVSGLNAVTSLSSADKLLVTVGTTGKYITYANVVNAVYGSLAAYVTALTAVTTGGDDDVLYVLQGGIEKKITLAQIAAYLGLNNVTSSPEMTTINNIPQWTNATGTLKDGIPLATSISAAGSDAELPTTKAVRDAIGVDLVNSMTDIGAALSDADTIIVDDGGAGKGRKTVLTRLVTYLLTKIKLDDLTTPDDNTDLNASTSKHGLLPKLSGTVTQFLTGLGTWVSPAGLFPYETLWIPAGAMTPSVTDGATPETKEYGTNNMTHDALLFDGLAQNESAEFDIVMPETWNKSTVKAKIYWTPGDADANAGEWIRFALAGGARADDDALDAAIGITVNIDDQVIADDDLHVTAASGAITIGGTVGLNDLIHFKLTRDYDYASDGTAMDVDCRLFGVLIQFGKSEVPTAW